MEKPKEFFFIEEFTFVVKEYVERVWMFTRDCSLSDLFLQEKDILLEVNQPGITSWMPGIEFEGKILKSYIFKGKCTKVVTYQNYKKIKWQFNLFEDSLIKVHETLHYLPSSTKTVILVQIKFSNERERNVFRQIEGGKKLEKLFNKAEEIITKISKNLYQFESCILRANMEDIWKIMTKMNKLKLIAPKMRLISPDETEEEEKVGEIKTITVLGGNPKSYKIKVTFIQKRPNSKRWVYAFESVEGNEEFVPIQSAAIHITRVSNEECQLCYFHDFKSYVPFKFIKGLSNDKIYVLDSIKDYLENFNQKAEGK